MVQPLCDFSNNRDGFGNEPLEGLVALLAERWIHSAVAVLFVPAFCEKILCFDFFWARAWPTDFRLLSIKPTLGSSDPRVFFEPPSEGRLYKV